MAPTRSEALFQRYCEKAGLCLQRIPESEDPTPDYMLVVNGVEIVVEVKEFQPNTEERKSDELRKERGYGSVLSAEPGARVRKKIDRSAKQIRSRTEGIRPSILVLFDRGNGFGHLDSYNIRTAMHGLEQVHVALPKDRSIRPYATGMSHGPGQRMTATTNTSISAVGALWMTDANNIRLHVYHNAFAAVPLCVDILAEYPVVQFLSIGSEAGTRQWKRIEA